MKYVPGIIGGLIVVAFVIFYATTDTMDPILKPHTPSDEPMTLEDKAKKYPQYKEIVNPSGYVHTDGITLGELVGKKVILLDIMTYSCINCIRTFPFLVDWYDKYQDDGLEIVGIHTPEFAFEHKKENVEKALAEYGITFPVVLDNDYATWNAYGNRYWPRKYLIDIDGYVVYDHIGEGAYDETELKIQELLQERKERLGEEALSESLSDITPANLRSKRSPETYFGAWRNHNFSNGDPNTVGVQILEAPEDPKAHTLNLDGEWDIQREYAENKTSDARIVFRYTGNNVFIVAEADEAVSMTVLRDGEPISFDAAGADVENGTVSIQESRLYRLIEDANHGEHVLELIISAPGVRAFAFTFG